MRRAVVVLFAAALVGCTAFLDPSGFFGADGGAPADASTCRCRDGADECAVNDEGAPTCHRPGAECGACPAGYACEGGDTCACADSTACGVECATDDDCGSARCDAVRGVCRPALGCLNYNACLVICVDLRCVEGGDVPTGGACRTSEDCFDGYCREGFCAASCLYNDDCSTGDVCGFEAGATTAFCMPATGDCAACTDPFSICSSDGECLEGCEEQLDCFDVGDACVLSSSGFACRPSTRECGEGEVFIESAGACALPLGCYTSDDPACRAGYECRSEQSLGLSDQTEIGFCLRSG